MIDTLKRLIERLEQMPEDEQEEVVRRIEDIDDRKWDELLATPESIAFLDALAAEAEQERQAGLLIDLDAALEAEE